MKDNVLNEVINIIRSKLKKGEKFSLDGNTILSELDINSITLIEIVVALESTFKFEWADEKLLSTAFSTILSMAEYVESEI
jgi:Phosphopantetheine attachment site.